LLGEEAGTMFLVTLTIGIWVMLVNTAHPQYDFSRRQAGVQAGKVAGSVTRKPIPARSPPHLSTQNGLANSGMGFSQYRVSHF
jgi:hypothetical protein